VTSCRSWNPLVCTGTALAPPLLLAAKLLVLYALVHRSVFWDRAIFLPFVELLDPLRGLVPPAVPRAVFLTAGAALLLNRAVRPASAACGVVILWGVVASRPAFSNSVVLLGCLLLLLGLGEAGRPAWLLRVQVVLVYLGAGLDKLLDPAWLDGAFIEFWTAEILTVAPYRALAGALPPRLASTLLGWLVIALELALAAGFAWPRTYRPAIAAGLGFHLGLLVFTGGAISWVFLYVMGVAYLAFVRWPSQPVRVHCDGRLRALLARIDVDRRFEIAAGPSLPDAVYLRLEHGGVARVNGRALGFVLARCPLAYAVLAGAFFLARALR
jgi:hypothetical protein